MKWKNVVNYLLPVAASIVLMGSSVSAHENLIGVSSDEVRNSMEFGEGPVMVDGQLYEEVRNIEEIDAQRAAEEKAEQQAEPEGAGSKAKGWKVCIDPGHQGNWVDMSELEPSAPGSSEMKAKASTGTSGSYSGMNEFELTLDVSLVLREELENRGYEVVMTREDNDKAISNKERAELAAQEKADVLVRIHANGSDSESLRGALAMVPSQENPYVGYMFEDCYALGSDILSEYCKATGFPSLDVGFYDDMSGINWSTIPVMILEMGYMSNPEDDLAMADSTFWPVMAEGIANGIDLYFADKTPAVVEKAEEKKPEPEPEGQKKEEGVTEKETEKKELTEEDKIMNALHDELVESLAVKTSPDERWSVEVIDLDSKAKAVVNDQPQQAASLIKLYIMGAVMERYDAMIKEHGEDHIDSLLYDMITVSDNSAANTLTNYLGNGDDTAGRAVVTKYCTDNGYTNSIMGRMLLAPKDTGDNITSVGDVALFLQRAYEGELPHADTMIAYLKAQQRRHKIPAGLPEGVVSGNKTGELDDVENDAAIVFAERPYILVCMSEDLRDPGAGQHNITNISTEVYQFFQNAFH